MVAPALPADRAPVAALYRAGHRFALIDIERGRALRGRADADALLARLR